MVADLVIKNGTIVSPTEVYQAGIAVTNGKIVSISSNENLPNASKTIDASGLMVLPGVIDVHVHFRDPGYTYKEDFASGSQAAAAGGVTTIFDMPNNSPSVKNVEAFQKKVEEAKAKAVVDYALYGLLTVGNLQDVSPLIDAGVIGFKCYMGETVGSIPPPPDGEMLDQFAVLASRNRRVAVHAENDPILQYRIRKLKGEGRSDAHAHYESRTHIVEEEAVSRAIMYAKEAGNKLHIAHLSSIRGVGLLREAKRRKQDVTAETGPHYLLLDDKQYEKIGSLMKMNPSIKLDGDKAALWEALNDGTVDMIATDHSPHALEEKQKPMIFDCISGFPGVETAVPLMLTAVNKGMIPITRYVQVSSFNPARAWGLYPRKGNISVGADADLIIVDMKKESRVEPEKFYSKAKWSPFDGFELKGQPVYTIVRGNVVMDHGHVETKPIGQICTTKYE